MNTYDKKMRRRGRDNKRGNGRGRSGQQRKGLL